MDELTKNTVRNNISAGAYLLLAITGISFTIVSQTGASFNMYLMLILQVLVGTAGIILLVLKKRDLTALCFLMFALLFSYYTVTGGVLSSKIVPIVLCIFILFAFFLLGTKEAKKTSYFCVFLPYGIGAIGVAIFGYVSIVSVIFHIFFALVALFYAIIFATERFNLPLSKKLKSDESIEFTRIGPVLGYYLFATLSVIAVISLITNLVDTGTFNALLIACGVVLAISGIINAIFSQQKFTPVMFILMGISVVLVPLGGDIFYYVAGGIFILLFILALLQKESMVLPALMLLFTGALFLILGFGLSLTIFGIVLTGLSGLIALYIAFALLFEKKSLPLF